ncbi:hypothetical protein [uncultured Pseudokineococcus sp.]|uniref:hypothetical protein n=1 Tax=uncultured Pseudokineococcus sp. TaxID=1642928 RepID=UPI0026395979|nr:hypothetical protein [uncultured Pseudokineococcus sp.]
MSWLPNPGELYAVRAADLDAAAERPDEAVDTRPVWLLKSLPVHGDEDASEAVADHMKTLEHLQDDVPRDSLLALVDAIEATDWDDVLARSGRG